jgi:catechol 2,3-dioxygenase-like lactoylglutathione lyase family enzyme
VGSVVAVTTPQLGHYVYYVEDVALAVAFFQSVFGFALHATGMAGRYVELITTANKIIAFAHTSIMVDFLHQKEPPVAIEATAILGLGNGGQLSLQVPLPVEAWVEKSLQAGATLLANVALQPWGHHVAFINTPFNLILELSDGGVQ